MNILGISSFYHDSAAALVRNGDIVAAAQEERFTRKKHDSAFPVNAVGWCLKHAGIRANDVECIVFYEKPLVKFERILETYLTYAPLGIRQFIQAMPLWMKQKLWVREIIRKELDFRGTILFAAHHESHAASAFYPSPFQEAAFLTIDGVGEWDTASFGVGKGNAIEILRTLRFPHSLGLLYSAFTLYCGFKVNSGEYKLMGLAPYGEPRYANVILENILDLKEDGSFKLNLDYFGYCYGMKMINARFERLFGAPARAPETTITQYYMDVASSIQKVTEEVMLKMVRHAHVVTGSDSLCLAGGVALNCVGNGRIIREGPFRNVWVQPASGDAGAAMGAALIGWYSYFKNERICLAGQDSQYASFLGPSFNDEEIESFLKKEEARYTRASLHELPQITARLIEQGNVVGWFQGRMEFGPRALGARSIIGDSRNPAMQSKMNLKIKYRESFRPFAPAVLREQVSEWFDLDRESPYMLFVAPVKQSRRATDGTKEENARGFDKLKAVRCQIPAVTHVDYSARIQTIARQDHPLFYDTIDAFFKSTGCPVIINTSFNVRGEPLVCSPQDAFICFMCTEMDYLVMGKFILCKKEQKQQPKDTCWQQVFELD